VLRAAVWAAAAGADVAALPARRFRFQFAEIRIDAWLTMTPADSDDVEHCVAELSELAAGQGFTAAKARRQEALLGLGYRARSPTAGEDPAVAGLRSALLAAIALLRRRADKVGSPRRYYPAFLIAETALALGRHTSQSLMDRRNDAALTVDAAGTTFAKYERQVLRELAVILVSHRDDPAALDEGLAGGPVDRTAAEDWSILSQERLVYLDPHGAFSSYSRHVEIQSRLDGLRVIALWMEYYADPRQGVVEAIRASNASILRQADRGGGHVTELSLEPPLRRGESRNIGIDFAFHTDVRCVPRIRCSAFSDMARTTIAVQFDPAYRPDVVWCWNQVGIGREFAPAGGELVRVRPSGYVEFTFYGVRVGTTYGLSWEWPDG
jgi:hypothetical protein